MPEYYYEDARFHMVDWKKKELDNRVKFHEPSLPSSIKYQVTNAVNGLVCLYHFNYGENEGCFFIYNLTTRENLPIPKASVSKGGLCIRGCYLGFDPRNKRYKVLYTNSQEDDNVECQVLTVGSKDSTWRPISVSTIHDSVMSIPNHENSDCGFCCDGVFYWTSWNRAVQSNVIVAFNVEHETFEFVCYPQELIMKKLRERISICLVGGYVSLAQFPLSIYSSNFILWSLIDRKDKDRPLWIKKVITCPLFYSKWESVRCSDFGLLSLAHTLNSSNVADIECYDLETGQHMVLNLNIANGFLTRGGMFRPSLMVENIMPLQDI